MFNTRMGRGLKALGVSTLLMALCFVGTAQAKGPFDQGSMRIAVGGGTSTNINGDTAFIIGGGLNYYLVDGLEVGLDGDYWFGADPGRWSLSPQARYVLHFIPVLKPYAGAFMRQIFIDEPYDDLTSLGVRAGAFWVSGGGSFFGFGVAHEVFTAGCDEDDEGVDSCAITYPEITLAIAF